MPISRGEVVLALTSAIVGAVGSIVGAVLSGDQTVNQVFQGPQVSAVTVTSTVTSTTTATPVETVTVTAPTAESEAPTEDSPAPSTPSGVPNSPVVRHEGQLTLVVGAVDSNTDLDSPQSDSSWGRESRTGDADGDAPYISGSTVTSGSVGVPLKLMTGEVTFASCAALGENPGNVVSIGDLRPGSTLCLRTSADRWARLVVNGEPSGDQIVLDVTVWEKP